MTYEEAFTVQPFNNYLVSMDSPASRSMTCWASSCSGVERGRPEILQVSKGFSYAWTGRAPARSYDGT